MILSLVVDGSMPNLTCRRIGAPLLFERLWQESGCRAVVEGLLAARRFEFAVERAVFLTVLHRLMVSGSDRACEHWRDDYHIDDIDGLDLHHLYRAMSWLGEELPATEQAVRTHAPRCIKDLVEERLFARQRQTPDSTVPGRQRVSVAATGIGPCEDGGAISVRGPSRIEGVAVLRPYDFWQAAVSQPVHARSGQRRQRMSVE